MPDAWYYSTAEEQVGPISLQELKNTLPTLPNAKDVYIWHDSLPEWIRAGDLAEFVARKSAPVHREPDDDGDNNPSAQDEEADAQRGSTSLDELHLDELHPDLAYAITAPSLSPAEGDDAVIPPKGRPAIRLLLGAVLFLLGFGLVGLRLIGALPRVNSAFALIGALLLVAGLLVIWFGRSKTSAEIQDAGTRARP
jgi:hypothetical protein